MKVMFSVEVDMVLCIEAHYKKKISEYPFEQRLQVAVKCLFYDQPQQSVPHLPNDVANRLNKEAKILCSLNHPNIKDLWRRFA